ncbi:MAG: hypothetical protein WC858_01280 [Parcubacteria group bacterium]|jgi:hypothetical protein
MDFISFLSEYFKATSQVIVVTWWFAFPIALFYLFKNLWYKYIIGEYYKKLDRVLLEIKPPRNIEKSPKTMEQVISTLYGVYSSRNLFDMWFEGKYHQDTFSFEIVGIDGKMHFFCQLPRRDRNMFEAAVFGHYPEAEIEEVEDYTLKVPKDIPNPEWNLFGSDYKLAKEDAYPIRTYKYFQDDVTKGMIDPLATLADTIGGLSPGSQIWMQVMFTPVKDADWIAMVKAVVAKIAKKEVKSNPGFLSRIFGGIFSFIGIIIGGIFKPIEFEAEKKSEEKPFRWTITPGEESALQAVEESANKKGFIVKIRYIYLARHEVFSKDFAYAANGFLMQFGDQNLNYIVAENQTKTYANYFFIDPRTRYVQRKLLTRYRDRDYDGPAMFLNSEELATIIHLPDMSVVSPSIQRVEAKKGGPPQNLPVE